jgi:glycosyltransferase involved in cell wall biosynthesis
MEISVVIPTRDRSAILDETLTRLGRQSGEVAFEVIVIDDASRDGTPTAVREHPAHAALDIRLLEQPSPLGPAAARNRALDAAAAPVCLFLNDDTWPHGDLVERHARFHRETPEPKAALLGSIVLPADPSPTPFMRLFAELSFDYEGVDPRNAGGGRFFTANVSAKIELLREVGGFDESFPLAAHEDLDLGLRLEKRGMRLAYDADAVVEHWHPLDLETAIERLHREGASLTGLVSRHPEWPAPRRPGVRHHIKASALAALTTVRPNTPRLKRTVWRFLCHEATREGYWGAVDRNGSGAESAQLRIGRRLSRRAVQEGGAQLPAG